MLKVKLFFCIGIVVLVCCAGQQSLACVTQGYDEYVDSGCGNSACGVQTCGSGGGIGPSPLQNQLLSPSYNRSELILLAKTSSPIVRQRTYFPSRLPVSFALMRFEIKDIPVLSLALVRGGK